MEQIVAVLAPTVPDATPAQRSRAHRAMLEQMMLLARGHSVDSLPVRCAAEMVCSAVSPQPMELELAPPADEPARATREEPAPASWETSPAYKRYLRTIMAVN